MFVCCISFEMPFLLTWLFDTWSPGNENDPPKTGYRLNETFYSNKLFQLLLLLAILTEIFLDFFCLLSR
jgi:hypothetical protein